MQPNQLVMLAEAAAKAAEHTALLRMIQQQQGCQSSTRPPSQQVQGDARMSDLPWYKPLAAARDSTGEGLQLQCPTCKPSPPSPCVSLARALLGASAS